MAAYVPYVPKSQLSLPSGSGTTLAQLQAQQAAAAAAAAGAGTSNMLPILLLAGVAIGGYLWWKKRHS